MIGFLKETLPVVRDGIEEEQKGSYAKKFQAWIDTLAQEATAEQGQPVSANAKALVEAFTCTDCHQFHGLNKGSPTAPDLTGYGSKEWIVGIISDPGHPRFYGKGNDRMPAYAKDKILTPRQIEILADWLHPQLVRAAF